MARIFDTYYSYYYKFIVQYYVFVWEMYLVSNVHRRVRIYFHNRNAYYPYDYRRAYTYTTRPYERVSKYEN